MTTSDSCLVRFSKVILIFINVIFFLIGGGILGMGAYLVSEANTWFQVSEQAILDKSNIYVCMAFGAVILFVSVAGCVGAMLGDRAFGKMFLTIYSIVIFVIIAAEIVAGILVLSLAGKLGDNQFTKNQYVQNGTKKAEKALLQFADRMYNTCCNATTADSDFICINVKTLYKKQVRTSLRDHMERTLETVCCTVPYRHISSCCVCVCVCVCVVRRVC